MSNRSATVMSYENNLHLKQMINYLWDRRNKVSFTEIYTLEYSVTNLKIIEMKFVL